MDSSEIYTKQNSFKNAFELWLNKSTLKRTKVEFKFSTFKHLFP